MPTCRRAAGSNQLVRRCPRVERRVVAHGRSGHGGRSVVHPGSSSPHSHADDPPCPSSQHQRRQRRIRPCLRMRHFNHHIAPRIGPRCAWLPASSSIVAWPCTSQVVCRTKSTNSSAMAGFTSRLPIVLNRWLPAKSGSTSVRRSGRSTSGSNEPSARGWRPRYEQSLLPAASAVATIRNACSRMNAMASSVRGRGRSWCRSAHAPLHGNANGARKRHATRPGLPRARMHPRTVEISNTVRACCATMLFRIGTPAMLRR